MFGRLGLVWYSIVVLDDMTLLNIALYCSDCPMLPYFTLSYRKVGLYCSKAESRVPGWWCKPIIVSNPTFVELC